MSLPLYNRPYVELDFTRMAFDTRVAFSRSSTATRFRADKVLETVASNTPRIDHDPLTGAVRGLLLEEQRTNLLLRSQELDASTWVKVSTSIVADATTAPDGTSTADKVVESTENRTHGAVNATGISVTAGTQYSHSIHARAAGRSRLYMSLPQAQFGGASSESGAFFDLTTGEITGVSTGVTPYVRDIGGGWFRCGISMVATTTGTLTLIRHYPATATRISYAGDGVSGIYLWGAQFEAGSTASSYIPTTSAAVTRAADVASFTIPARVVRLVTIYYDGTTASQTVTPGATYTIPTGTKPILRIRGYFA